VKDPNEMILKDKSSDTLAKLIKASVDLFSTRGFKSTSVRDIAKVMNMSMAGIYNYFPTKEALFFFIFDRTINEAREQLIAVTKLDLPPMERFRLLLKTHFTAIGTHLKESKVTFLEDEYFSQENKDRSREYQVEIMGIYLKEIERLKKAGCINPSQPPSILALNIFGMLNWFIRWYRPEGKLSLDQVIDHTINFILNGIKGIPAQTCGKDL
jgi:AcrR family transcriptional regulator